MLSGPPHGHLGHKNSRRNGKLPGCIRLDQIFCLIHQKGPAVNGPGVFGPIRQLLGCQTLKPGRIKGRALDLFCHTQFQGIHGLLPGHDPVAAHGCFGKKIAFVIIGLRWGL